MNTRHLCLAISVMSVASGCALETRNREVPGVQLEGWLAGQALDDSQSSRLLEDRVESEFGDLTVVQRTPDGVVELTLVFADGIDALIDRADVDSVVGTESSVTVVGRAGAGDGTWREALYGRVLSVDTVEVESEDLLTERWRGIHETFVLHLLVDFDSATGDPATGASTGLTEVGPATPHPMQTAQQVDVQVHYHRDRVRRRPQERDSSSWDDDEC